jgi:hypothetical protein
MRAAARAYFFYSSAPASEDDATSTNLVESVIHLISSGVSAVLLGPRGRRASSKAKGSRAMKFSGKGKTVARVLFKSPEDIQWLLANRVTGDLNAFKQEAKRLIAAFDRLPQVADACANCSRSSSSPGDLHVGSSPCPLIGGVNVQTYRQALDLLCGGSSRASRRALRCLAVRKGLRMDAPWEDLEAITAPQPQVTA